MDTFTVEDVYDIKNPAYVVKERRKEPKQEEGGCVVAWNEEFEKLTNFEPSEIDNMPCNKIFEGAQHLGGTNYKPICKPQCQYRVNANVGDTIVLRDFWINSKHWKGLSHGYIKQRVNAFIFPFKMGTPEFCESEFVPSKDENEKANNQKEIKKQKATEKMGELQKTIKRDYALTLSNTSNVIDWLNELLTNPNFFDVLTKKGSGFSEDVKRLLDKTQLYREGRSFLSLNSDEQNNIKQLNRLLLEQTYGEKVPKSQKIYTLHILVDRGGVHTYQYFEEKLMHKQVREIEKSLQEKIEKSHGLKLL